MKTDEKGWAFRKSLMRLDGEQSSAGKQATDSTVEINLKFGLVLTP